MTLAELKVQEISKSAAIFHHIVAAVDFSPASRPALSTALVLANANSAHLTVVHVLHSDWRYEMLASPPEIDLERIDAEQQLKNCISQLASAGFQAEAKFDSRLVKGGPIAPAILSVAGELNADLLIVGTHGRSGLSKFAIGSVAEELLRIAPFPVMTVGPKAELRTPASAQCAHAILFATDFGSGSKRALPFILQLTKAQNAKLILLHMILPMPASSASLSAYAPASAAADEIDEWSGALRQHAMQQLREFLPAGSGLEQEPEYLVGTDFLAEGVLTAARKFSVDLIVMGANRTASAKAVAHVPWTAVHEVLIQATCPVLTFAG